MKRIKFIEHTVFETHGPNHPLNPVFERDAIVVLTDDQALRWFRRNRAVLVLDLGPDEDPIFTGRDRQRAIDMRDTITRQFDAAIAACVDKLNKSAARLTAAMLEH